MRLAIVAAVCCSMIGLAVADPAKAAMKMPTDIPAQGLGPALKEFARDRGLQVVFRSEVVGSAKTHGAHGDLTANETLSKLLEGTNLGYSYVDDNTVAILTAADLQSGAATPPDGRVANGDSASAHDSGGQKSRPFRLAQLDQGANQATSSVSSSHGDDSGRLEEIVVSAQKKGDERLQTVPVPVSVVNSDQLTATNQVLLRDYYTEVPGLNMAPNLQSAQIISIRGVTTGDYTNPTVGILVDDVPYCCSSVGGLIVPDFDPGDLARIEVLRGPQGTLYGASSMGGLIKYVTIDPSTAGFSGRVEAGTEYVHNGAEPGFSVRGSANIPLNDTLAIRVSAYNRQDAGYINNPGNCDGVACAPVKGVNEAEAYGGRLAALWIPSDDFSLKLSATYQDTRGNGLPEVVVGSGLGDLQQNYIPNTGGYDRSVQAYSGVLKYRFSGIELTSITGYDVNRYRDSFDATPLYGGATAGAFGVPGTPFFDFGDTNKVSEELHLSSSVGSVMDWLVGGFYTREHNPTHQAIEAENSGTGQVLGQSYYDVQSNWFTEYAGFANLTFHITDRFDVQVGGRESHTKVRNDESVSGGVIFGYVPGVPVLAAPAETSANAFTYLFTPSFKLTPDVLVYARLASGYRPGGPNQAVSVAQGGTAGYAPDKTEDYELGLKGDFLDHRLYFDASVYHIAWKNLQIFLQTPSSFGYTSNGSRAKSDGVELSVTAKPLSGLTLSAWGSYDDAALTEPFPSNSSSYGVPGNRLPDVPRFSANLSGEQDFPLTGQAQGFVGATVSYIGDRIGMFQATSVPREEFPSYTKTDLRLGVKVAGWTANLFANNVADIRGVLNRVDYYPDRYIYIQPRTIGLSVSKTFN